MNATTGGTDLLAKLFINISLDFSGMALLAVDFLVVFAAAILLDPVRAFMP